MASLPELPEVGDTVAERYELRRVLGEGGMGIVYEAFDRRAERLCAIKILFPHFCGYPEVIARFDREAQIAAKLRGPNVARVFGVGALPSGLRYIAMELLTGRDLAAEIQERGHLPVARAVDVVIQAAQAMEEAHALGVIHRDLKPENLFVVEGEHERPVVKVLDFGVSRLVHGNEHLTADFAQLGTVFYMSPEQIEAASRVDARTDVWSLGVVLYEMLVGRPPFEGEGTGVIVAIATRPVPPPSASREDLHPGLEAVVMRALEKSPDARFQTMAELARALAPWASADGRRARTRRSTARVLLVGAVAAAAAAIGVVAVLLDAGSILKLGVLNASAAAPSSAPAPEPPASVASSHPSSSSPARRVPPARGPKKSNAGAHPSQTPVGQRRP